MPHFRLIVLHTPIWGQSWGLNCILHHYFRFILKGIFAQTHSVILIRVGVRHRRKNLPQTGDFTVYPAIAKCEKVTHKENTSDSIFSGRGGAVYDGAL